MNNTALNSTLPTANITEPVEYHDMFDVFKLHNITTIGMDVPIRQVPEFYSRYIDLGFTKKFADVKIRNPVWRMTFWSTEFGMSPWNEGENENNMKYLLHYYMVCLICFTMSFIVEYMNGRRYNMQAKALRDHNPLIKRKGLQSLTKQ